MVLRRAAREWALQLLFQLEANPVKDENEFGVALDEFWATLLRLKLERNKESVTETTFTGKWRNRVGDKRLRRFAEDLVRGVLRHHVAIDEMLARQSENWDFTRFGTVERNVMRVALYEMLFAEKPTPVPVAINEAVDIGKFFGGRGAGPFVNGILDKIAKKSVAGGMTNCMPGSAGLPTGTMEMPVRRPALPAIQGDPCNLSYTPVAAPAPTSCPPDA